MPGSLITGLKIERLGAVEASAKCDERDFHLFTSRQVRPWLGGFCEQEQQEVGGIENQMNSYGREEGFRTDIEPSEGDAEEPERNERGGVDVDDCKKKTGEEHGTPDGHDLRQTTEKNSAKQQFFEKGGLDDEK